MPKVGQVFKTEEPRQADANDVRLAVNLFDLDRIDVTIRQILLAGKLDTTSAIRIDPNRPDETAIAFSCDLLTAGCICDTLRNHDRNAKDYPTRVYLFRKVWAKLPGHVALIEIVIDKPRLNPKIFTSEPQLVAVAARPLATKRIQFESEGVEK